MNSWKKLGSREQKVGYKVVTYKDFLMPDGKVEEFTIWHKKGMCIATIALTKDNKVVVAREFRPGPELIFDELPGGRADKDEDLEKAARRELLEETGYESSQPFKYLGSVWKDAYTNELHNYFLAYNCEATTKQKLDVNEHIEIGVISIEQLFKNAQSGKMSDSVALLFAYEELKEIMNA